MTNNQVSNKTLDNLVELSKAMIVAADSNDWGEVAELDIQRRQFLDQLSDSGHAFDPGHLMLASRELSTLDQELMSLVRSAKDHSAQEHKNVAVSRKGIAQYQLEEISAG